jgi:hypothetical protein
MVPELLTNQIVLSAEGPGGIVLSIEFVEFDSAFTYIGRRVFRTS